MSEVATTLLLITGLFIGLLFAKRILTTRFKFCAICLAVSGSWLMLLILNKLEIFNSQLVIGILMGQSSLGIYYLLEKKVNIDLLVFRLPLLLTLTLIIFSLVTEVIELDAWLIVAGLWLIIGFLYTYRTQSWLKAKVKTLIDCCSDW
jgi:hypothetical protein